MSGERIVQRVLDQTSREQFDQSQLVESYTPLVEHLQTNTLKVGSRDAVCKAIIDNTLPKLTLLAPEEQVKLANLCQQVLNHGDADKVFRDLCIALKQSSYAAPLNARFLVGFVSKGGIERIATVLAKLDSQETISLLVHLPSLVMNALGTESIEFKESDYFISLSKAICKVSKTSDHQSNYFISTLLQRMVTLGKAEILISSCCAFERGRHLKTVLQRAPHSSIEALVRAILQVDVSSNEHCDEGMLNSVLGSVILQNATAEQACIGRIPFSQPPLKASKIALVRLVEAIAQKEDGSTWKHAVTSAASVWNSQEFVYCAELKLQQQVTRLVLYYMSRRIRDKMHTVTETDGLVLLFSPGIQLRLSENDPRIRRHGMVVGEAASRVENGNQKLTFPRDSLKEEISSSAKLEGKKSGDGDSDSDLSTLAHDVDSNESIEQIGVQVDEGSSAPEGISRDDASSLSNAQPTSRHTRNMSKDDWSLGNKDSDWQFEDDWESIDSWDDEDQETDTQSAVVHLEGFHGDGTALRIPVSVNHLLNVMINANKSRGGGLTVDAATAVAALDQISALPDSGLVYGETLRLAAVDLCLEVCRFDVDRYPDEEREGLLTARRNALEQMICVDLQGCGLALIEKIICGPSSDVGSRIDALSALTKAFRLSSSVDSSGSLSTRSPSTDGSRHVEGTGTRAVDQVSTKSPKAFESAKTPLSAAYTSKRSGMFKVFHHLAQRMCEGGGAGFLRVESRDSQLWGHAIVALATVASCAGMSREGIEMRRSVIEVSMRRVLKIEADAVVRRAVVLAVITVIKSMGATEVSEVLVTGVSSKDFANAPTGDATDLAADCFQWLTYAAEFDSDIGVRRFTRQALGLWAKRVEQVV